MFVSLDFDDYSQEIFQQGESEEDDQGAFHLDVDFVTVQVVTMI